MSATLRCLTLLCLLLTALPAKAERIYVPGTEPKTAAPQAETAKAEAPKTEAAKPDAPKPGGNLQDILAKTTATAAPANAAKTEKPAAEPAKTEPAKTEAPKTQTVTTMPAPVPAQAATPDYQFLPLLASANDADTTPPLLWPLLTSQKLAEPHDRITRAVIVLHDSDRNAALNLQRVQLMAGTAATGAEAGVLIVAPLFPAAADMASFTTLMDEPQKSIAQWNPAGWPFGADSENAGGKGISSFTALDMLLLYLAEPKFFPALKTIVIAGYGSGGDAVQRYALFGNAPDLLTAQKTPALRFVAAAPQSYAYLTNARPKPKAESFAPPDAKDCADYNNYPYGPDSLNPYARWTTAQVARLAYAGRDIAYLVGANDATPGAAHCAAKLQGDTVKNRAANYARYVRSVFAEDARRHRLAIVRGAADDAEALWNSPCGASLLFADGECPSSDSKNP